MKQELYIDGIAVDIDSDTSVTLNVKSNLFRDITKMTANTTYTIKLPRTAKNARIFGYAEVVQASTTAPYQYHDCRYFRNGVEIIKNGKAVLLSVSDRYEISVIWALNAALSKINSDSVTLNAINGEDYVRWNRVNTLTDYETFLSQGYGYAKFNAFVRNELVTDWEGSCKPLPEGKTDIIALSEGAIITGEAVGEAISFTPDTTYTEYQHAVIRDLQANYATAATLMKVVGGSDARAYAFLDESNNVLSLAPSMLNSGVTTETISGTATSSVEANVVCYNSASGNVSHGGKVTSIVVVAQGADSNMEYGLINTANGTMRTLGKTAVKVGLNTISVDADKDNNEVVYLKPSTANVMVRLADTAFTSYTINGQTKASVVGQCFAFRASYEAYDYAANIGVSVPTNAVTLVVNVVTKYSSPLIAVTYGAYASTLTDEDASVKLERPTTTKETAILIHPSVSVQWLLQQIANQWGVAFSWDEDTATFVNSLAIPLVAHNTSDKYSGEAFSINVGERSNFGTCKMRPQAINEIFSDAVGTDTETMHVKTETKVTLDVQCRFSYDPTSTKPYYTYESNGVRYNVYRRPVVYLELVVTHAKDDDDDTSDPDTYLIGTTQDTLDTGNFATDNSTNLNNGRFYVQLQGTGVVELKENDTIVLNLKSSYEKVTIGGFNFRGGTIKVTASASDEVPNGGKFPIQLNLPDIKVTDFVKFLNVITGTFPRQRQDSTSVEMATYDTIYSTTNAYDWTEKLVPYDAYNRPREASFAADDYCRSNWYKWKEDDTSIANHDGNVEIANATMDETRDVVTFPFACSYEDEVPLYEVENIYALNTIQFTNQAKYTYKECKDRILQVEKTSKGNASLIFGDELDMQHIIDTKYAKLRETLNEARIIKEYVRLTDIDIMNFNEARPVYFAQFGAYFAVTEIKQTSNGYCEVSMIRIKI